jgi:hypothetical protein
VQAAPVYQDHPERCIHLPQRLRLGVPGRVSTASDAAASCTVTATSVASASATASVVVTVRAPAVTLTSISLSPPSATIAPGATRLVGVVSGGCELLDGRRLAEPSRL